MMHHIKSTLEDPSSVSIAVIVSLFNREITQALQEGALAQLVDRGVLIRQVTLVEVPGAIEIPVMAQRLAKKNQFDAIIALGAVIRGETTHYDYVCHSVMEGCLRVSLDFEVPVIFGVLTTENDAQAWDRLGGAHGHKGRDAADCALMMSGLLKQV
jgi:6,7-dimethyl-8-ribityllumazine synthase